MWINTAEMEVGLTYQVNETSRLFIFLGWGPKEHAWSSENSIRAKYSTSEHSLPYRKAIFETPNQPKENTMTKLYEITTDGITVFGTKLAVNSSGDWVMEIKGEGTVLAVPKVNVQEVFPYTVEIKFNDHRSGGTQGYNYFATAGDWAVGDLVVPEDSSSIATVTKLDCKSTAATKWLSGMKLQGTYIKSGE